MKQRPSLKMWLLSRVKCLKFASSRLDFAKTFLFFFFSRILDKPLMIWKTRASICTHKHTVAIGSVVKDNDMLELNEPTHHRA